MKKIFISSTFYDMHAERDLIQNIVQPAINQRLKEQGEYVSFSDLRWGIDTINDETEHKILDSCFDEIFSCQPFFLVFIGGRYGWIPSNELLIPYQDRFGNIDILNKSVTELEILYALKLNENRLNHCLFYFKDDVQYENEDIKRRINELRNKIEQIAPSQIRHYTPVTNTETESLLSNQIVTDICDILSIHRPITWEERVTNQIKVRYEMALPSITSHWLDGLQKESVDLAVLLYPECRIKESFIINFSNQIKSKANKNLISRLFGRRSKEVYSIYVNIGATKDIAKTYELQKYLIFQICKSFRIDIPSLENLTSIKLRDLMSKILTEHVKRGIELYIIISEYDKLIDALNTKWLPDSILNVRWVISLSDASIAECLPTHSYKKSIYGTSHIGGLPFDRQIAAYEAWSGKTLPSQVKRAISNLPYASDYLILEVIFNRLMHFDGKDIPSGDTKDLPKYMEQYIKSATCSNRKTEVAIRYFLEGDFYKFNPQLCELIFVCMSFFNRGLTISDMEGIANRIGLKWTELDIIRFLNYESFLLTQYDDGRYDITSNALSNILVKLYYHKFKFEFSDDIYEYMHELSDETSTKIDNFWLICYMSNRFRAYMDYLKSLYELGKDNNNIKSAFLPLFSNAEAVKWMETSLRKEKLQYDSTDFVAELVSIVSQTFSEHAPKFTEDFIAETQNIENLNGDLTTKFRQHYTLAIDKIKNSDYEGFIKEFDICLILSKQQFKKNPPCLKYLDEDVDHKYPIASFQDMLESEYGFSFVEEIAALMSKYSDLPKEYRDEEKASCYADKVNEIRTKISKVSYILPQDIQKIREGNSNNIARKKPSLLRGKAIELSKQADRSQPVDLKIKLLKESIRILEEILAMPQDDLTGVYKDSQKSSEFESAIYWECHRDMAISYEKLSDFQEGKEKLLTLENAFEHALLYTEVHKNCQSLNDISRITHDLIKMSSVIGDENKCLKYCISGYVAFVETASKPGTLSFEERLAEELSEDFLQKEIRRITTIDSELRSHWIYECKNHINSFQSLGNYNAMIWMAYGLNRSFSYYVNDLNLHEYKSEHIHLMRNMLQNTAEYLHIVMIYSIHESAMKYLNNSLSKEDTLSVLHLELLFSRHMIKNGEFDNSLEASQEIIDYCKKNKTRFSDSTEFADIELQAYKLNSSVYMERNDILNAWTSIDKIANYTEILYKREQSLDNITELANAKLNQVILWDKMSADSVYGLWTIQNHKVYDAQKQLYDTYMLCYNFEKKDEQLNKLMRRIRQSHEIIREKGLGYLATSKTMDLVKHFRGMVNAAVSMDNEGRHEECVRQFTLLAKGLAKTHFVDIYFDADWYAGILFILGREAWAKGDKVQAEHYYEQSLQIRHELESEGISQNQENFALNLYFYALLILSRQLTQDSISQVLDLLNNCQSKFAEIEHQLQADSLSYYSSCCFNLGQIICLYTTGGNKVGLPFIESAINIMDKLVDNYGLYKFEEDREQFRKQYEALKNRNNPL